MLQGGDPLSSQMRAVIREFGIEALSAYGSIEAFYMGFECERHTGFHLNHDLMAVRVVGSEGEDLPRDAAARSWSRTW